MIPHLDEEILSAISRELGYLEDRESWDPDERYTFEYIKQFVDVELRKLIITKGR